MYCLFPYKNVRRLNKTGCTLCVCACARAHAHMITMHAYVMYTLHDLQYHNMIYTNESKSSQTSTVQHILKSCAQRQAIDDVYVVMSLSL